MIVKNVDLLKKFFRPGQFGNFFLQYVRLTNKSITDIQTMLGCTLEDYAELAMTTLPSPHDERFVQKMERICLRTHADIDMLTGIILMVSANTFPVEGPGISHRYYQCNHCETPFATRFGREPSTSSICPACAAEGNFTEIPLLEFCVIANIIVPLTPP
jgi:hypothetical protein